MRAQACGMMGNRQVQTPNLDLVAEQGVTFTNAVSTCPVCTPYRASLLTGRYPLTMGVVLNDVRLPVEELCLAEVLRGEGYETGYVGKWHLDGPERGGFTPPGPRRQGFEYWAVANCTHDYLNSFYYRDDPEPIQIEGYDADLHTDLAVQYIREHAHAPFCLFVSWGPPHNPCGLMPEQYKIYAGANIEPRPNAPEAPVDEIAGYYSHITALDRDLGRIMQALDEARVADNTILVFTSDHGDMLGSQGETRKQKPWEESIMVPFAMRWPGRIPAGLRTDTLINAPDVMPTLLSLMEVAVPDTVEGRDLAHAALGRPGPDPSSAFIGNICPFGPPFPEWRGLRTKTHTYVRTLEGPWLLYDNENDPYQLSNVVDDPAHAEVQERLDDELDAWLDGLGDDFQPREVYWERFGYQVDDRGVYPHITEVGVSDLD